MYHSSSKQENIEINRSKSSGFTLIELSILMIVLGLLAAAFFAAQKTEQKARIVEKQAVNFEYALTSLREFVSKPQGYYREGSDFGAGGIEIDATDMANQASRIVGNRYPCPADPAAGIGNANFALESLQAGLSPDGDDDDDDPTTGANNMTIGSNPGGVCNTAPANIAVVDGDGDGLTGQPTDVIIGALPFRTLGMSVDNGLDAYDNQYTYAITAGATAWDNAGIVGRIDNFEIDAAGAVVDMNVDTVFALVSHGEEGRGAFNKYGQNNGLACAGTRDAENCDNDDVFIMEGADETALAPGATFYSDFAAGNFAGINADRHWDSLDGSNIFNINDAGNGNVGIGTDDDSANDLTQAKLTIRTDDNEHRSHLQLLNQGTNDGRFSYGGAATTPESDSFAMYIQDYTSNVNGTANPFAGVNIPGTTEAIVFENLDIDNPNPDDGMYFINTGNDGVQEIGMYLSGDNWLRVGGPGGTNLTDQSSAQTASGMNNRGFIETPWIYTQGIEASNERLGGSTGITIGESASPRSIVTEVDTIGLYAQGRFGLFIDGYEDGGNDDPPLSTEISGIYIDSWDNDGDPLNTSDLAPAIGVGTSDPAGVLDISTSPGGDFLLYADDVTGTVSLDTRIDTPSIGTTVSRMIFDVDSGAFRAGIANGTQMNATNIGPHSIALGRNIEAPTRGNIGLGDDINFGAGSDNSVGLGRNLTINGSNSIVLGESHLITGANDRNFLLGRDISLAGTADDIIAFGNGAGSTIADSTNFIYLGGAPSIVQGDAGDPTINAENNVAFLPGRGNVVSSGNFVWSDAGTATSTVGPLNGGGNIAFFNNDSTNSSIIGDSSMGVFLSSNNSSVSGSQSVGYFMGQTGVTLARDNVFAIMGANVGIRDTDSLSALQINGANRAESHFDTSDRRWKKNIQALNLESLEVLKEITPVRYTFKTKKEGGRLDDDHEHIGFIAQDVQAVLPDMVREDAEGYLSLETTKMTVLIADAAGRLKTENETLKEQIALTQSEINAAKDQIKRSIESFEDIQNTYHEIKQIASVNKSQQANLGYILMMIALFIAGLVAGHQSREYACPEQDAGQR